MWAFALMLPAFPGGWLFLGSNARSPDNPLLMLPTSALPDDEAAAGLGEASAVRAQSSDEPLNFDEVYQDHFPFVWRVVRRQGVALEHVDDVCQEVFIIVHRRLPEFEQRAKVRTWIYQIITNVVRNQRRTTQRKSVHARSLGEVVDPDDLDSNAVSPEASTGRIEAAQAAREILMGMNEKQRMAFVLVELEGMSLKEVADATDESFHTIRSRLRSARAEFQRHARRLRNVAEWGAHG